MPPSTSSTPKKKKLRRITDEEFIDLLRPSYPGIDLAGELRKMDAWLLAHPGRTKTKKFVVAWLNRCDQPLAPATNGHAPTPRALRPDGFPVAPVTHWTWFHREGCAPDWGYARPCIKNEFWDAYAAEWGTEADRKRDQCERHRGPA